MNSEKKDFGNNIKDTHTHTHTMCASNIIIVLFFIFIEILQIIIVIILFHGILFFFLLFVRSTIFGVKSLRIARRSCHHSFRFSQISVTERHAIIQCKYYTVYRGHVRRVGWRAQSTLYYSPVLKTSQKKNKY